MSCSKHLLVVDGDPLTREAFTLILKGQAYTVCWAADGHDALDRLRAGPQPDCILLDLWMPRMDGPLFLVRQQWHPDWASIPVIAMSGDPRVAEMAAFMKLADYLIKPVLPEMLLAAVSNHC
jgi:CheY-like chemotaxis protein